MARSRNSAAARALELAQQRDKPRGMTRTPAVAAADGAATARRAAAPWPRSLVPRLRAALAPVLVAGLGLAGLGRPAPAHAGVGVWTTGGPGERVTAVAVSPATEQEVLAAGETGVWKTTDGGATWTKISAALVRRALAIDPQVAGTVYAAGADAKTILKSGDGGATWATVYAGAGSTEVRTVAVDPHAAGMAYAGITHADGLAQVLRTTDGGATWTPVLPADMRGTGGIGHTAATALAPLPGVAGLVFAGVQVYHGGFVARSANSGAAWSTAPHGGLAPLAAPSALAAAGTSAAAATVYAGLNVMQFGSLIRSDDGGATWTGLTSGLPLQGPQGGHVANLATNPRQPRWVYLTQWDTATPPRAGVFASADRGQTWHEVGRLEARVHGPHGLALAIPSRTLYAATDGGVYQSTLAWPPLARFQPYYDARDGYRLLGTGISLQADAGGYVAQYFEKGRLEDHSGESPDPNWQFMYGLLVDELHGNLAPLPVGGDVSTLTYAGLHDLAEPSRRVAPPPDYPGAGPMPVGGDGATFVPFTTDLRGAPGHVVPARFWAYVNRTDLFPGGWLHDVGLPIGPAQEVLVTKYLPEGPVARTITVQAFQRTILTDDPLNPPDWQVERANVGSDYRKFFADRVGP